MPEYVSAYQGDDSNAIVTVSAEQAEADGLQVLKSERATDKRGRPLGPRPGNRKAAVKKTAAKKTTTAKKAAAKQVTATPPAVTPTGGAAASNA